MAEVKELRGACATKETRIATLLKEGEESGKELSVATARTDEMVCRAG